MGERLSYICSWCYLFIFISYKSIINMLSNIIKLISLNKCFICNKERGRERRVNIKWKNVTICEANYLTWLFEKLIFSSPFYYVYANFINNSNSNILRVSVYKKKWKSFSRMKEFFLMECFFFIIENVVKKIKSGDTYKILKLSLVSFNNVTLCDSLFMIFYLHKL